MMFGGYYGDYFPPLKARMIQYEGLAELSGCNCKMV